ncbi:MAG: hypothetical protein KYX69_22505 [Sphingomonas sp.]|uniref:hypothetical protein n=1 Tax=Sphingomonas sp. TaxID=28214 RepID=UPI0026265794|nr:hypothetical protein [Sphingomonas sp.]MDK2770477.1 hypothetical protein [Sphingomonas sp.]
MITLKELEAISASKGDMPADEWAALLESCPEWVAQRDAREAAMQAKEKRYLEEETPLREALHRLGYPVKWVWDFVNAKENYYLDAIPTLIDHLQRPYNDEIREGIARSLAMKEARGVAGVAVVAVLGESGLSDQLRWALANTLATVADRSNRDAIKALLQRETNKDMADRLNRALKTAAKP